LHVVFSDFEFGNASSFSSHHPVSYWPIYNPLLTPLGDSWEDGRTMLALGSNTVI
jgi:hypothetical protein